MDQPSVVGEVADELVEDGAEAVVLLGSHARGDAGPESDVDVLAVGPRTVSFRLERRGGLLVSVTSRPLEAYRRELTDPGFICAAVPGWREAVVLHDPHGTAAALVEEARAWTWAPLEGRCDRWVAEEICSLAEEVHKLIAALRGGRLTTAAVQRSVLAVRLAGVMAVHRRILYGSENHLWELVSDAMGEGWRVAQSAALGLGDEGFEETCGAALRLYGLAVDETHPLLDKRQQWVVRHARDLAKRPYRGLIRESVDRQACQDEGGDDLHDREAECSGDLRRGGAGKDDVEEGQEAEPDGEPEEGLHPVAGVPLPPDDGPDQGRYKEGQYHRHQPQQDHHDVQKAFHGESLHQSR